jgi:hypothetical protein
MKELIIKGFDIKAFWHSFDIWVLTFEIVLIPNYLSIQVTGKKKFVKPFLRPQVVTVSSRFHFKNIFIPPMKSMQHLHRYVFGVVDDAFEKNSR